MSAKRKIEDGERTDTPHSHGRKKVKIQEARQIVVQVSNHNVDGTCPIGWMTIGPTPQKVANSQ